MDYDARAEVRVDGESVRVGRGVRSSDSFAVVAFTPELPQMAAGDSVDVEVDVDDVTSGGVWAARFTLPDVDGVAAPISTSDGRLAVLADPEWVCDGHNGIRSWIGPVVLDPTGIRFDYQAIRAGEGGPSLIDHEVTATVGVNGRTRELSPSLSTSLSSASARFEVDLPEETRSLPVDFELSISAGGSNRMSWFTYDGGAVQV